MSIDEQDAAIGRLTRERTDANRQCALIADEINKFSIKASNLWGNLAGCFQGGPDGLTDRLTHTIGVVDSMAAAGGLDRLKTLLSEHLLLSQRIAEIGQTLKQAGVE